MTNKLSVTVLKFAVFWNAGSNAKEAKLIAKPGE